VIDHDVDRADDIGGIGWRRGVVLEETESWGRFGPNTRCAPTDPVVARNFAKATFLSDNRADLKYNTIDALVLQCSEDMIAPLEVGDYLEANLPHSVVKVLKATGHCPHMSHPGEVIEMMKMFLSK
jgi:sigma-B regulation protein RsbQ